MSSAFPSDFDSEQTSAVQHENAVSLPVEGPLPEEESVRLAPAAKGSFPPLVSNAALAHGVGFRPTSGWEKRPSPGLRSGMG
jgi:hypothetical protein